jgi:ribosomal protein L40E
MSDNVKPWDLLNPQKPRSPEELAEYRFSICKTCPAFRPKSETCRKCGCFMKLKTKLEQATCPIGKW